MAWHLVYDRLRYVTKNAVAYVMAERRETDHRTMPLIQYLNGHLRSCAKGMILLKLAKNLLEPSQDPQRVLKPAVSQCRVDEVRQSKLSNPPEALEKRSIEKRDLPCCQMDITLDRVGEDLVRHIVGNRYSVRQMLFAELINSAVKGIKKGIHSQPVSLLH